MLTVRLGLPIGRITFFAFRQRATFHTAWTQSGHSGAMWLMWWQTSDPVRRGPGMKATVDEIVPLSGADSYPAT
jgi:hypothetical protein